MTPLDTLAREYLVWAHLLQNVVLAEWAPLLLVLGIPPGLAERLTRPRAVRLLTSPFVALPLWVATYALWHVPALYDAALRHPSSLLALEHGTYLLSGFLFWWCVWQDVPHRLPAIARAGYVFAAFVLSAPLGLVLALVDVDWGHQRLRRDRVLDEREPSARLLGPGEEADADRAEIHGLALRRPDDPGAVRLRRRPRAAPQLH